MSAVPLASAHSAVRLARTLACPELPASAGHEQTMRFLKVDNRDILNLRRALVQSGAAHARIHACQPAPRSGATRVCVVCDRKWTGVVMRCVMQTVTAAEFGRCMALAR